MQIEQIEMDVAVGDVIRIGEHTLLVVDTQGEEVTFKLCSNEDFDRDAPRRPLTQPR